MMPDVEAAPRPLLADTESTTERKFQGVFDICGSLRPGQWLYMGACFGLLMLLVYANSVAAAGIDNVTLILVPCVMIACYPRQTESQPEPAGEPTIVLQAAAEAAPARAAPKPRYYYLDNIKAFLTFIVVVHHVACAYGDAGAVTSPMLGNQDVWSTRMALGFGAANQGYFMCLFCFISGYFTPKSHARKGTRDFMKDKLIRYGIPYLVYYWCLNPLCYLWTYLMFVPDKASWRYVPGAGPPWFLQMLLLLNAWYVVCPAPPLRLKLPSLSVFCLAGVVIGVMQGWIMAYGFNVLNIPTTIGSFPFDARVVFFYAGCVAARDEWLADLLRWPKTQVVCLYCLAIALLLFNLVGLPFLQPLPPSPQCLPAPPTPGRRLAPDADTLGSIVGSMGAGEGVYTVVFSLATLHFFATFLNWRNKAWDFFAAAAYGVYVFHFVLLAPAVYAYVSILRATGTPVTFVYCAAKAQFYAITTLEGWQLLLGFLFTSLAINLPLWPAAFYVRKLPGFRRVL